LNTPLLTTKLFVPSLRPAAVARPHLVERLTVGVDRRLTLISAPAGFGKTSLAAEWAATAGLPLAWLSLEQADDRPERFWAYLAAALQRLPELRQAGVGKGLQAALRQPQRSAIEGLLATLVNEIATLPRRCALLLDDLQCVRDSQIHQGLIFLLEHLPVTSAGLHLIVSSRIDPPWPLARWRAQGKINELRAADLRFCPEETAKFLNESMDLDLRAEQVAALEQRVEGWAAGLQMAALAIQGRKKNPDTTDISNFIRQFSGVNRYVLDYLVSEVLDGQPPEIQNFLLQTSIVERLSAPLCEAIIDPAIDNSHFSIHNPQQILEQLENANLFLIPLDDKRRWYRYHHLFAELLQNRLARTHPDLVERLHLLASDWFHQEGMLTEAVRHALAAGDYERAATLLEGNALVMMDDGELSLLLDWLGALPSELMLQQPWLNVASAWFYLYNGQIENTLPYIDNAAKIIEPTYCDESRHILGHITTIRGYIASHQGETAQSIELARQAMDLLPESDVSTRAFAATLLGHKLRWSGDLDGAKLAYDQAIAICRNDIHSHTFMFAHGNLGELYIMLGKLMEAYTLYHEIQELAEIERLPALGYVYSHIAIVLCEWNRLDEALDYATRGEQLSKAWGQIDILVNVQIWLALVLQARGNYDDALGAIGRAYRLSGELPWLAQRSAAIEANILLTRGDLAGASAWADASGLSVDDGFSIQTYSWQIVYARVLYAQGDLEAALLLVERLLAMVLRAGANGNAVEVLVLQALALQAGANAPAAQAALERALALAEPGGYVRTFIREGAPMANLLRQAIARSSYSGYARKLLAALEEEHPEVRGAHTKPSIETLSERELEVLRLLDTSLSSRQIAEQLFISVNTARTHIRVIYEKLGVHKRYEAIERGKEIGYL
jgi:LuxR family maltose regulon positive regulatory protein